MIILSHEELLPFGCSFAGGDGNLNIKSMNSKLQKIICGRKHASRYLYLMAIFSLFLFYSCSKSYSNIKTKEFQNVNYSVIKEGKNSDVKLPGVAVCYNRHFNENMLTTQFRKKHHLDTISYKNQMTIQFFLGHQNRYKSIEIDQVKENKKEIKIFFKGIDNPNEKNYYQPFIIAKMHKAKKDVSFFMNGEKLNLSLSKLYL